MKSPLSPNEVVEKPPPILLQHPHVNKGDRHGALPAYRHESAAVAGGSAGATGAWIICACRASSDQLDLSAFNAHYRNDDSGAPAHAPTMLLNAVLLAYAQPETTRSRQVAVLTRKA
jgi:hypothetical protein